MGSTPIVRNKYMFGWLGDNMILLVKCPKCNNRMKVQVIGLPVGKTKRCVYCGKSFTIRKQNGEDRIIKRIR